MKIVMTREVSQNMIASDGVVYRGAGCKNYKTAQGRELVQCEMVIKPKSENLALLFKAGFQPLWYESEWRYLGKHEWLKLFWPW